MARGRFEAPRPPKPERSGRLKFIAVILTLILAMGGVIGGTVAWLTAEADPVINTFTYGDINIDLKETDTGLDEDTDPNTNDYEMLPGQTITKDPVVTVKAGSEELWLFVKLEESENFDTFMEYEVEAGWTALPGVEGVYYRHITAEEVADADLEIHVLANDTITVKESVTKEMLNELDADPENPNYPTLTVTAYAVQYAGNPTAADAWAKVESDTP